MSDNPINDRSSSGEIDLLELMRRLFGSIGRGITALARGTLHIVFYLLKKWLLIVISIIAGVVASFFLKTTSNPYFATDIVLRTNVMSNADIIAYINRLHVYSMENNLSEFSKATSLPNTMIDNIQDISAYYVIDKGKDGRPDYVDYQNNHNVYDTVNVRMTDRLDIHLKIKVPAELSEIRDGIIRYINSDSLFQQRNRFRINQNNALLARLNYDIEQLDSLQKIKYFVETKNRLPQNGGQMVFLQEQKTQLVYNDIYSLYARKQSLEGENNLYKSIVTVISDFSIPAKRANGLLYYASWIVPFFLLLSLIADALWQNRRKIKELSEKY